MGYRPIRKLRILNNRAENALNATMSFRALISSAVLAGVLTATSAQAACYADYKAKQDNPLRLHYGVVQLGDSDCKNKSAAKKSIAKKISKDGWTLLSVIGIFDQSGLQERKKSAGAYYLKY